MQSLLFGPGGDSDSQQHTQGRSDGSLGAGLRANLNVRISILHATGLRKGDWDGRADPYCAVFARTPRAREIYAFRTQTLHGTLAPEWNFQRTYDLKRGYDLEFVIMDKDRWSSSELGRARLPGARFLPHGFAGALPLSGERGATLTVKVEVLADDSSHLGGLIEREEEEASVSSRPGRRPAELRSGLQGALALGAAALLVVVVATKRRRRAPSASSLLRVQPLAASEGGSGELYADEGME